MAALITVGPCDLPADISEEDRGRTEGSKYECKLRLLNPQKVKITQPPCLRFSLNPNCPSPSYTINGVNIAVVVDQRDLGVTASHDLSWRTHYSKICSKAYHTLHFIRRSISTSCPIPLKRSLYTSLIRSQLTIVRNCGDPVSSRT